jgi:CO/xanthine dehydrogenase Mo-binding subunit
MNPPALQRASRRAFLRRGGALVMSFSLVPPLLAQDAATQVPLPGSLKNEPLLDAWIRVDADNAITVFTGKAELGQGIKTALLQLAAEELMVQPGRIALVAADTARTPNEGYTAGSHSMQDSGTAIRNAAAQVRELLLQMAATRLALAPSQLRVQDAVVRAEDGRSVRYGDLVAGEMLHVNAQARSPLKTPDTYAVIGKSFPRIDIPAKVTGGAAYVHDLRLPGMLHARVVRPAGPGARLRSVDAGSVERLPGFVQLVRDGSFLAVVAQGEYQAVQAMRALGEAAVWDAPPRLPAMEALYRQLLSLPARDDTILERGNADGTPRWSVEGEYRRPYQMHASIGPSCAVALLERDALTVWTHSQGVYPLRDALAEMLGMPAGRIRCIHLEGSGCYGHNGADDAAADAALIARALPGRPVRVQWMRDQEHLWEPYGPAMLARARAALDGAGNVADWQYEVWSNTHSMRPGKAGHLLAAQHLEHAYTPPPPKPIPQPEGGGDRNAIALYDFPRARVVHHFIADMPVRVSALRSLGAYLNVFAIESFMDELARKAGADVLEFRLRQLRDARAAQAIRTAATHFGWSAWRPEKGRGRGFAFARYKNLAGYCAIAMEVSVDHETGRVQVTRVVAAVDSGEAVNPDGLRNQVEGGIVQSLSWSLYESVNLSPAGIVSMDWSGYPILRFSGAPERIDVHVIDRPSEPFLGTGEIAQGPTAAALANAIADATGTRLRELPFTAARVKAAIGV